MAAPTTTLSAHACQHSSQGSSVAQHSDRAALPIVTCKDKAPE